MAIHRHILWNGQITEAADACLKPGQVGLLSGWGVFSTFRVMNGALFAWERHWARMTRDAKLLNIAMPEDAGKVYQDILRLLQANDVSVATVRLVVVRNGGGLWEGPGSGLASDTIALTAPMKKWGGSVRLGIQPDARYAASDFTRAKILSWAENLRWAERAQENGFDEVVLLNERGQVTECTSANIFAVFGSEVVTAPATDGCLPGITREVLLEEIHVPGITVLERSLSLEDLYQADEVFITSSTRDTLSVSEIAGRPIAQKGSVRAQLSEAFQQYVLEDVTRRDSALALAR